MTLPNIGFQIGSRTALYRMADGEPVVEQNVSLHTATAVVVISAEAYADVQAQMRTFVALHLAGELSYERGGFEQLADWDPFIRLIHAGVPMYDPARADLSSVDLNRTFTLDDSDDDMRHYLQTAGFIHVRGVFSPAEMDAVNAEVDRLAAMATKGDDESWFAIDEDGNDVVCRLVYAGMRSDLINAVEYDARIARLGTLLNADLKPSHDRMEGVAVLLKVPGQTTGLSNIPWHQDCGMGGHAIFCPSVGVGIWLTGSSPETGNITFVPGSQGQSLHSAWQRRLHDVPVIEVNTEPGDVTVHIKDVMHASPQPTGVGGRRTMYVSHFPLSMWDHIGEREAFNDVVRNRTDQADALTRR